MGALGRKHQAWAFIGLGLDVGMVSSFSGKKILITGINGFVGSHLAAALHELGAHIEGTSRTPSDTKYLDAFFEKNKFLIHAMDLRKRNEVDTVLSRPYDLIFHLASQSDTWNSVQIPQETFETNVNGTLHILENVRHQKKKPSIIIAGSVRAFEPPSGTSVEVIPLHPYDASKLCMQVMALSYFNAYNLNGAIAQNTNVFGPNDLNYRRLIPRVMKDVCAGDTVLLKGDGTIRRDFLYVKDAVNGLILLAQKVNSPDVNGKSFTFASGKVYSIREVAETIEKIYPDKVAIAFDEKPFEDRDLSRLDAGETQRVLGWKPEYSLENGLRETIKWYRQYFNQK